MTRLNPTPRLLLALAVLACLAPVAASDYLTEGNDPGRTGWMKDEKVFTLGNVKDMRLLWKVKLDSQPREMHNLFSPLIAGRVTTARGARELAIVAGISDDLFAIDVASGELLWKRRYESTFAPTDKTFADLIAVNDRVYTATSGGCGGAADGIWAIDIASDTKPVVSWKTNGGPPIGSLAFATNGTAIAAIGSGTATPGGYANAIVALDPKTLAVTDWFRQPGVEFAAPPLLFQEGGKDIVAITTKDGRILLLDAASLGGPNHDTPLFASASLTGGAATFAALPPAMWQERAAPPSAAGTSPGSAAPAAANGARWLLIPVTGALPASLNATGNGAVSNGAILGVKVAYHDGKFSVQPGWVSQSIAAPLTPIVVNGVAFAAAAPANAPAALYALHGTSGKALWQSGKTIASPLSGRSFWAGSGHVFAGTRDGTVYAFGFAMERK